jgi:hypothetical protein
VDSQTIFLLRIAFWILATGTLISPMRWSLFCFIVISQIDITSSTFDSATAIGVENGVKTVLLPTIMFLRFSRGRLSGVLGNRPVVLWLLLTFYAAVSCAWTPFQVSGLKMVGYLYCYVILGAVFWDGWRRGELTPSLIGGSLWVFLFSAATQTYLLGNEYGRSLPGFHDDRFTTFCSPQFFGASLLALLSVLLITERQSFWSKGLHALGGFGGIILSGSRYAFLGSLALLLIVWRGHIARHPGGRARSRPLAVGMVVLLLGVCSFGVFLRVDPTNRINQLVTMIADGKSPLDNIGTLLWRRGIYEQAWNNLSQRGPAELILGSGTSSGALAVLGWDLRYSENRVDANRVIHNEILRVLFEWGFVGLFLFVAFVISIIRFFLHSTITQQIIPAYAFLAFLPTLLLGFLSENILAGASSPAGVGILISMMYGVAYSDRSCPISRKAVLERSSRSQVVHAL